MEGIRVKDVPKEENMQGLGIKFFFFLFLNVKETVTGNTGVQYRILTWIFTQKEAERNLKGSSVYIMTLSIVVIFC